MDKILNTRLMSNPANWIIIFLMIAIAYMGAGLVATAYTHSQS